MRLRWTLALVLLAGAPAFAQDHLIPADGGVKLDPREAVLELRLASFPLDAKPLQKAAFPTFLSAYQAADKMGLRLMVSADTVRAIFDEFNDGMMAGLLVVLGNGNTNEIQGKAWVLRTVLDRLVERRATLDASRRAPCDLAILYIAVPLVAGGQAPPLPPDLEAQIRKGAEQVAAADPLVAPYGFLTRHRDLQHLRRLDRAAGLGIPLDGDAGVLAALLIQEILLRRNELDDEVVLLNHVREVLCGPSTHVIPADWAAVFKPGDSFENLSRAPARLAGFRERLVSQTAIAKKKTSSESFAYVLFDPLRDFEAALLGRLPADETQGAQARVVKQCRSEAGLRAADWHEGWLSTRATVLEAFYRLPAASVRERAAFAAGFEALTSEDYLPPLAAEGVGKDGLEKSAPGLVTVRPPIPLEPAPEYYLALARAVHALRKELADALGLGAMSTLTRLEAGGSPASVRVIADLPRLEGVFYGLHFLAAETLGLATAVPEAEVPAADQARQLIAARSFCANLWKDPGMAVDTRWAVPIDRVTREGKALVRAWGSMGVRLVPCELEYRKPPHAFDALGKPVQPIFAVDQVYLPVRLFKSIEVENLTDLTPEGFRELAAKTYKAPPLKLLTPVGVMPSSRYQGIILTSCALGFVLLVAGSIGMFYFKKHMMSS